MSPGTTLYVNADGLSETSRLRVEILDDHFKPLPEYSGEASLPLEKSGFRQRITWQGRDKLEGLDRPFRVRVSWEGRYPEDARLYAVYVQGSE